MQSASINYLPCDPAHYRPKIGLVGCGAITKEHLTAYRTAGYDVAALCDIDQSAVEARRKEFFPEAFVTTDAAALLAMPEIEVVDIATHVAVRPPLVQAALEADKHVLSQKPFVLDLAEGQQLISVAEAHNRKLAVNQNGRWAPHFCFMRRAIAQGLIGQVQSVQMAVHWDHNWIAGTEFDGMKHVILFDFAIHWFDMLGCFLPGHTPLRVHASCVQAARQRARPPLLGQASIEYEAAQAQLFFNGNCTCGARDTTSIVGTEGTLISTGADLRNSPWNNSSTPITAMQLLEAADVTGVNLAGNDMVGFDLGAIDLRGADLSGADLLDASLSGANLTDAMLVGALLNLTDFSGADLSGANLIDADLHSANLTGAHLNNANLTGAWLYEADLSGADLSGSILTDVLYDSTWTNDDPATWTNAFYYTDNEPTWASGMDAAWRSSVGILALAPAGAVPEPAALLLALFGLTMLPRRRR